MESPRLSRSCKDRYGKTAGGRTKTSLIGAVAELQVQMDLARRGYAVIPIPNQIAQGDLVAIKGRDRLLIEVKKGYITKTGAHFSREADCDVSYCDYLAIVTDSGIVYKPELHTEYVL